MSLRRERDRPFRATLQRHSHVLVLLLGQLTSGISATEVVDRLLEQGLKIKLIVPDDCRMITHYGIRAEDVDGALFAIRKILGR